MQELTVPIKTSECLARQRPARRLLVWLVAVELATCIAHAAELGQRYEPPVSHRITEVINREWTFNYFPAPDADGAGCQQPGYDDSAWPAVALPHTWQTYETTRKLHPFIHDASEKEDPYWWYGWGWYRKHFSISQAEAGRRVFIEFDGVQKYSKVFVNGRLAGDHKGGYTGFSFDITSLMRFDADNVLAVAVNNRQDDRFKIPPMSAGNWNTYGGIYRDVRLVITDPLYIPFQGAWQHQGGTFVTTPTVSAGAGVVRVRTWVQNEYPVAKDCELRTTIADAEGKVVQQITARKTIPPGELAEFDQTSQPVTQPHLWSPETPYVYAVYSDVLDGTVIADHFESPLGFREFKWDYQQDRLILNGKKVIIHGSNRHQEYPWLGDATPKWLHLADMQDFRYNLNHNFMRTAHYPNDPVIYDFCDRNGIMVIEEQPNDKRQQFSTEVQVHQLREAIRRDRNHPSIFFWSVGNETDHAVDSKYVLEEDTTRLIHARDIYNDSAGKYVQTTSKQLALESLLRCTIRGWYDTDERDLQPQSAQQAGTETWQHDENAQEIIERNQGRTQADMANLNTWIYEDHGCDRDYANAPLRYENPKGFVDCWRTPKYFYYLWQAVYADKPMVFVHPHFWRPAYVGEKKEIVVDSNCDTVELKVNGRSLGTRQPEFSQANVVRYTNVLVEPGVLSAEGRKAGEVVRTQLVMAGPAARVVVSATPQAFAAALDSAAVIRADIVDAQGNHVYGATNTLQWSVAGPATLIGPPSYATDTAKCEAAEGTMYIDAPAFNLIRGTSRPGQIKVRVRSPGLASGEVLLTAAAVGPPSSTAILQPAVAEGKRGAVALEGGRPQTAPVGGPELKTVADDLRLSGTSLEDFRHQIDLILRRNNPTLEAGSPEFRAVVSVFAHLAQNNGGSLVRDDVNFTVGSFNDCCRITCQLEGLSLPALYKQSLREYFARAMIEQGEPKDYATTTRWLAALPQGKVVVAGANPGTARSADVLYAERADLGAMVALALPKFEALPDNRKPAVLDALCALNPNIKRQAVKSGGRKVDGVREKTTQTVSYQVKRGQAILVPSLQALEQFGRKQRQENTTNQPAELRAQLAQ